MNKNSEYYNIKTKYLLIILSIIILILVSYTFLLKNQLKEKNDKIKELELDVSTLNKSYERLYEKNEELYDNYTYLENKYNNTKKEVLKTINQIDDYKKEIQKSIEWYKSNSELKNHRTIKSMLRLNCFDIDDNNCEIKTGCLYLINDELDIKYKNEENDKILSLDDFIENGGGDCEDFSLLYKAEYNYFLSECGENKSIIFDTYTLDGYEKYWLDYDKDWYLEDVSRVTISDYKYPSIVCGNIFDLNQEDGGLSDEYAHCLIAFTKKEIKNINDIEYLNQGFMIEPQDGSFLGFIGNSSSNTYLINEHNPLIYSGYIDTIITDSDYLLYSYDEEDWISYDYFYDELNKKYLELYELDL